MGLAIKAQVAGIQVDPAGTIKWIQCATAGRLLEVSRQRVYQLCRTGVLSSQVYDGRRYVSLKSVIQRVNELTRKEVA